MIDSLADGIKLIGNDFYKKVMKRFSSEAVVHTDDCSKNSRGNPDPHCTAVILSTLNIFNSLIL